MVFQPKQYKWRDGFAYEVDADIVGGVIEDIEKRNGEVTREAFLEESRPEDAPTHLMFEWDDSVAAEQYRLSQSRKIITNLQIVYLNDNREESAVPAVLNITNKKTAVYKNIVSVMSDGETKQFVLDRLRKEVEQFIARNRHIEEFADILEDALNQLKGESA